MVLCKAVKKANDHLRLRRFESSSWRLRNSTQALGTGGISVGVEFLTFSVFGCGETPCEKLSGAEGGDPGAEEDVEGALGELCSPLKSSIDLSKSNKPKLSITKKISIFTNFTQNSRENQPFLIALIDKLSYNRICVNILGKCTLFRFYEFYETFKGVLIRCGINLKN